jgi:hypothetical protein
LRFDDVDAVLDTPVPMWWWDIVQAHRARDGGEWPRTILTTRDPRKWAARRRQHCLAGTCAATPPAILRPCGRPWTDGNGRTRRYVKISALTDAENARLLEAYEALVRCVVPPGRLFEVDLFASLEDDDALWRRLAEFLGREPPPAGTAFPGSRPKSRAGGAVEPPP